MSGSIETGKPVGTIGTDPNGQNIREGPIKLNIGCGHTKYAGFVNIDKEASCKPDIMADLRKRMPYDDNSVDEIWLIHTIEHVEKVYHTAMLLESHRILRQGGVLLLVYPEFIKCAENYINNYLGKRKYWEMTLFGRQNHPGDYHVCAMNTSEFLDLLTYCGFRKAKVAVDPHQANNTIVRCIKGATPTTRQELYRKEIWNK